jgi:SNF2 family DNA or RNA helicase
MNEVSLKRNRDPEPDEETAKTTSIWKTILFPDEEDQLDDMMERALTVDSASSFQMTNEEDRGPKRRRVIVISPEQEDHLVHLLKTTKITKVTPKVKTALKCDNMFAAMVPKSTHLPPIPLGPVNELGVRLVEPWTMFPYQISAVRWLAEREAGQIRHQYWDPNKNGALLAMVMGLGKTLVIIALILKTMKEQKAQRSPTLYVCPKNLLGTVRNEFTKFSGDQLSVLIYHRDFLGSLIDTMDEAKLRTFDVIITNYDAVTARINPRKSNPLKPTFWLSFPFFRIILDESHEIREQRTKKFQAFAQLHSPRRICMSGTPIFNSLRDIVSQLQFTGCQLPPANNKTKYSKELLKRMKLLDHVLFIEHKDAPHVQLPNKQIHTVLFDLQTEEKALHKHFLSYTRKIYDEMYSAQMKERPKIMGAVLQSLIRVMQICSAPFLITPAAKEEASEEDLHRIDPVTVFPADLQMDQWVKNRMGSAGIGSSKMKTFVQLMSFLKTNHPNSKIVVFANYASTLRLAEEAMRQHDADFEQQHVLVTGKVTSARAREDLYNAFRTDPAVRSLFMTLRLGNQGLNFTEAHVVIMLEVWYSYSALHQGECRVYRLGQKKDVHVYYLIGRNSIEERVYRIAMEKKKLADDITTERESTALVPTHWNALLEEQEEDQPVKERNDDPQSVC